MVKKPRSDGLETRQRLLKAACRIFAWSGFNEAKTAEICRKADVNAAAINYHFGSKQGLYADSWRHAFEESIRTHPPDGGVSSDAPPEERLRGRIHSLLSRVLDPESHDFDIVHKEMVNPTGLLAEVMRESIEPLRNDMEAIIRELLGPEVPEEQIRLCRMSVIVQCLGPSMRHQQAREPSRPAAIPGPPPLPPLDVLAEHVTRFSLAGIGEIRRMASDTVLGKEAHRT
ncbi:MAG: CerR family C-terminal domain-containing protein [Planctomycetes bacterium]|nr:CerR family C-terminal domain-containing protein [Planctomycetota bacterium]